MTLIRWSGICAAREAVCRISRTTLAHGRAASQFVEQRFYSAKMLDAFETLYGVN